MKILIPMTGHGSRFKSAGYSKLKPFIEVQGKPIIEWVVDMFPGDKDNLVFICRKEHLVELDYFRSELERIAPMSKIVAIDEWVKLGPVNDILRASNSFSDIEPVIVSYCDYYMKWDYHAFKESVLNRKSDGAIPCYTGFHPHLLPKQNLYASCKVDIDENLIEIREKFSWEKDKTKARHSPGVYYFNTGASLKKACNDLIESKDSINGEYYCSMLYNSMVRQGMKIWCPNNVNYFCQWGTPEDLEEFNYWYDLVKKQVGCK